MAVVCKARLLSDLSGQTACDRPIAEQGGENSERRRLCAFHARQCQALYRGYKRRNAQLAQLSQTLPTYLAQTKTSLVVQNFGDIEDETTLLEVHNYLFKKYNLIERVIRGRKLHHSHFYAVDNDYGHEKYLTQLQNEKHVTARALERLGKRVAQVHFKQQEWFDWVKAVQEAEENERENESRMVKLEALLFNRHQKEVARHQREMKAKEDKRRQDSYLEEAYRQRLSETSEESADDEWDPIQGVFEDERENYVDLIKFFLMLEEPDVPGPANRESAAENSATTEAQKTDAPLSKSAKKRAKKANSEMKKLAGGAQQTDVEGRGPGTIEMETKTQMRNRLREPVKYQKASGWYFAGSKGNMSIDTSYPPLPDDEIDTLLEEVAEIKIYLFCRLLLSHSTLIPLALQAGSIEELLHNNQVTQQHLRDLCLKLERPRLQDVRDACADFVRGEDEDLDETVDNRGQEDDLDDTGTERRKNKYAMKLREKSRMPEKFQTEREKAARKKRLRSQELFPEEHDAHIDFGKVTNEEDYQMKKTRIKICGRYMYNYPSEKALGRGGWFHFSIIAKDSDLYDAIELCRNWNEFFELNVLCLYNYFPAVKWNIWVGDILRRQLLTLGFIPYFLSDKADRVTHHFQTGSRGMARRSHSIMEMRNFVCGHIKRDDPISRRFIQYLSMETWEMIALARDPITGRVLIQPPEDQLWLLREKSGWGRASRNEYENIREVGPAFFEKMDRIRKWHFGFGEYYDVIVWDANPGRPYFILQRKLEEVLMRAIRVRAVPDMFTLAAPVLKTITKDSETDRARTLKPGEDEQSIWSKFVSNGKCMQMDPTTGEEVEGFEAFKYTEADELEDAILFPDEVTGDNKDNLFRQDLSEMEKFERKPNIDIRRFAGDLDSDDEISSNDNSEDADNLESDDGDEDWESEESSEINSESDDGYEYLGVNEHSDADKAISALSKQFMSMSSSFRGPDYFLPILRHPAAAYNIPSPIRNNPADLMATLRLSMMRVKEYDSSHDGMHADFIRHIDREKSKIFKHSWHMADFEPGARAKYIELLMLVKKMDDFVMTRITTGPFELCSFMQMAEDFAEERRVVKDAFEAYAAIALFFDTEAFLASEHGLIFRKSKLFHQAERANDIPDRRTHMSNKTMPKAFWKEFDDLVKTHNKGPGDHIEDIYPPAWRKAIRPIVVKLFKAGIICNSWDGEAAGTAIANAEPGRPLDLYIDYRVGIPLARVVSHLKDPTQFDRAYILSRARKFAQENSSARFTVLRIWSAPHFYPLMLGLEKRAMTSFLDDRARCWTFKFIPKDMPYSEWSVHQQLSLRLDPYKAIFRDQVFVAKDLVFVMGKDVKDVRRLSEGATFAIQTKPWRLEVDFWRSFINVDLAFLEELNEQWLE